MHSELPKFLLSVVYLIPALIAFCVGFELRKRFVWTKNGIRITLSIGLLEITPQSVLKPDELVQCGDKAMYIAKKWRRGQNFTLSHPESAR